MTSLDTVLADLAFPEGPRWHDGRLWFSDMHAHEVVAVTPAGDRETMATVAHQPSGLGWLPDGRLLVVSMTDRRVLRQEADGSLVEHADLSALAAFHCNDMVVDRQGRAYVGNFGYDLFDPAATRRNTNIVLVEPSGATSEAAADLAFPNGMVITPDGRTLVVGESSARCLTAFTIADDGSLAGVRLWAALRRPTMPDGISLDADGAIWSACPRTGVVQRIREGGDILDVVTMPEGLQAFACMLGGASGTTLFVCAAETADPTLAAARRSGRILAVEVSSPGAGWP